MHCGISAKPEMELLSFDLTSCYLCQYLLTFDEVGQNQIYQKNQKIKKTKKSKIKKSNQSITGCEDTQL